MKTLISTTTLIISTIFFTSVFSEENNSNLSNKEKAVALLNSIESGDPKAVNYINAKEYTQHNLTAADGLAGFGALLQALPKGSAKVKVLRSFSDGDYVFTHTDYNFFGPKVGFDLFRFEDGLIVEHWDNLDVKAVKPNPSGHTQLDGNLEIVDIDRTQANKELVRNFIESILIKGEMDKITHFFNGDDYIQHNASIADGLSGLGLALEAMAEQGVEMIYTHNHKILGEGNFVLSISEGRFAGKDTSFYDLFRVENGKIAEHWDIIEAILPKDQWKNSNGKFGGL